MRKLPKKLVVFGFNFCASMYIAIGVYGAVLEMTPKLIESLSLWHSAAAGIVTLLLIRGICYFGGLWDAILAREAAVRP